MKRNNQKGLQKLRAAFVLIGICLCSACGANKALTIDEFNARSKMAEVKKTNKKIETAALLIEADASDSAYKVGAGDLLAIVVFRVDDLTRDAAINSNGDLVLPLIGTLTVAGLSVPEVQDLITRKLAFEFLQNPQVSVRVKEYRSQKILVAGAVINPGTYNIRQPKGVLQMLSEAGGVSDNAADSIRVSTKQLDAESGLFVKKNFVLSINGLLSDREAMSGLSLKDGDAIYVPDAGVVYVEGAVKKPGAYSMSGDVSVLKAISLAGGARWESRLSKVRVVRALDGKATAIEVNLNKIRDQREDDLTLEDGDIVMVDYGTAKSVLSGVVRGITSIVGFGYNLNQ